MANWSLGQGEPDPEQFTRFPAKRKRGEGSSSPLFRKRVAITEDDLEVAENEPEPKTIGGQEIPEYITPNYQHHVFIALTLALFITVFFSWRSGKASTATKLTDYHSDAKGFIAAWIFLYVVLFSLASFRGTDRLAASFAWLIFVAVLLVEGETVFKEISNVISPSTNISHNRGRRPS